MFWLVQKRFLYDQHYATLVQNLDKMGISYAFATTVPFSDSLEVEGISDLNAVPATFFPFGSYTLCRLLPRFARQSAVFISEQLSQESVLQHFGNELLNSDMQVLPIKDINPSLGSAFFIRPNEDSKAFTAGIMSAEDFLDFKQNIMQLAADGAFSYVPPETLCVVASIKNIDAEYRFFVVNGHIAASSQYKIAGRPHFVPITDDYIYHYAQTMINHYQPEKAYVMDIAACNGMAKILEFNAIHAAGLYAADSQRLIAAIEDLS